jgi:hypothetical protein
MPAADIRQFGLRVEELGAVDEGEVMHLVHALRGARHRVGVADVAADELDVVLNLGQPARAAARIVVEHAHARARFDQRLDQAGADEAAAAGDEDFCVTRGVS